MGGEARRLARHARPLLGAARPRLGAGPGRRCPGSVRGADPAARAGGAQGVRAAAGLNSLTGPVAGLEAAAGPSREGTRLIPQALGGAEAVCSGQPAGF